MHLLVSGGTVVNAERIVFRDATDNARRLVVSSSRNQPTAGEVTVAFAGSAAAYAAPCVNGLCGQCLLTPATTDQLTADALAAEFNLTRSPAGIGVSINKRNLKKAGDTSTADHSLSSGHDSGTFGGANVVLHVREWTEFGDPSVTLLEKDADNGDGRTRSVYRFNGGQNRGAVRAWLRDQGGASSDVKLACPMLDDVTVTVLEG